MKDQRVQHPGRIYDRRLLRHLWGYARPERWRLLMGVLLLPVVATLHLLQPYLYKVAIDGHILQGDFRGLRRVVALFVALLALEFLTRYLQSYLVQATGQRITHRLRVALFARLQGLSLPALARHPSGALMTRVIGDTEGVSHLFMAGVVGLLGDLLLLAQIVVVMSLMDWKLTLLTFSVVPPLVLLLALFRVKIRERSRELRTQVAGVGAYLQENLAGMPTVQLFRRERRNLEELQELDRRLLVTRQGAARYDSVLYVVVEALGYTALAALLWYGGTKVAVGQFSVGALVAFFSYIRRFFQPLTELSGRYSLTQSAMASLERIFELFEASKEEEDGKPSGRSRIAFVRSNGAEEKGGTENRSEGEPPSLHPRSSASQLRGGRVEFRNIWFAYRPDEPVLQSVSFKLEAGEKTALVGLTGAGKTTLIRLLHRLYEPSQGEIRVDGEDIRATDLPTLRRSIGVVSQEPFLFSASLLENLRLGDPKISREVVRLAAERVGIHRFIEGLPSGYDFPIAEGGGNLSAGQRQILSLTRILVLDPRILVLDEATSHLDSEAESLAQEALKALFSERTSLVIAHRLSTLRDIDRIIVLHKGKVREVGTYDELLQQEGIFYRLHETQYAAV